MDLKLAKNGLGSKPPFSLKVKYPICGGLISDFTVI